MVYGETQMVYGETQWEGCEYVGMADRAEQIRSRRERE